MLERSDATGSHDTNALCAADQSVCNSFNCPQGEINQSAPTEDSVTPKSFVAKPQSSSAIISEMPPLQAPRRRSANGRLVGHLGLLVVRWQLYQHENGPVQLLDEQCHGNSRIQRQKNVFAKCWASVPRTDSGQGHFYFRYSVGIHFCTVSCARCAPILPTCLRATVGSVVLIC